MDVIKRLDPKPGLRYNKTEPRLVEPDVQFRKVDGEWQVFMNDDDLPQLRLSPTYRRLLARDAADRDVRNYVKERFTAAIQLMKNIEQRKHTILRVCHSILRRQGDFLDYGPDHLKPMMIKEVAEEVGVHPSTVSRAVANKYVHTPQGVLELRISSRESVNGPQGSEMSLLSLKRRVKQMIEEEDTSHPLTDEQITKKLERRRHPRHAPHRREIPRRPAHSEHAPPPGKGLAAPPWRAAAPRNRKRDARQLVILTGLSGSGKGSVLNTFEDLGFYCVDNLPVALDSHFQRTLREGRGEIERAALLVDAREGEQIEKLPGIYRKLSAEHPATLVFIEASDEALMRRFSETRRPHPLGHGVRSPKAFAKSAAAWRRFAASPTSSSTPRNSTSTSCVSSSSTASRIPAAGRCWFRWSASDFATAFPRMRIWFSTCAFCRIRISFRGCGRSAAKIRASRATSAPSRKRENSCAASKACLRI